MTVELCDIRWYHGLSTDESDRPPVANGGQDRVVQPQDSVTLNGIESKDDHEIVSFQWQMLTQYPHAVIEVSNETWYANLIWPQFCLRVQFGI